MRVGPSDMRRRVRRRRPAALAVIVIVALVAGACAADPDGPSGPAGTALEGAASGPSSGTVPGTTAPTTIPTTTVPTAPAFGVLRTPAGVPVPLRGQRLEDSGWVVGTPCGHEAVVPIGAIEPSVRVVIDPGHGGPETGTVSPRALWESQLNLDISQRIERLLLAQGVTVELTRRTDEQVTLEARAELARAWAPELVVSVHHQGGHLWTGEDPGTIVFHQVDDPSSRRLAGLIYEDVTTAIKPLGLDFGVATPPGAYAVRNSQGDDYYGILRNLGDVPGVIVESMYLTNPDEGRALESAEVRQIEAQAITTAIVRYLSTQASGTGFRPEMSFAPGSLADNLPATCADPPLL
ncbi:MAG: N-acetylmuramoyl-L-alanine amidase [Acidimicrobiales bacterium]|nr:N-acetylmuramoyl-L-alanine amidase [Acidimicrobiales bacterium]